MINIAANIALINAKIDDYAKKYTRDRASILLLAASKTQSVDRILSAYHAGQRIFGENYLQEALEKMHVLPADIEWHFIGHIQSNKTKNIAEHFNWVHSVDCPKIARRLNEQRPAHLPPLNICIEMNIDHETTKSGVANALTVLELARYIKTLPHLQLRGLMAIPAPRETFAEQRHELHQLAMAYENLRQHGFSVDTLSMGMSDDLEAAIAEGSTLVRVGTAIFGPRS